MVRRLQEGLFQIRGAFVCSYLLVSDGEAVLIDGGFVGGVAKIGSALRRAGLGWENVSAVLLTHGHLDHCYNVAEIVELSGARVYGHPADEAHFEGSYPYVGLNRVCGFLEKAGVALFGYRPVSEDWALRDGMTLDFWGGLEVVHLPGHTFGHCGFYNRRRGILFSGDLFATGWYGTVQPWAGLSTAPELFGAAVERVVELEPKEMLACHCDFSSGATQRKRFWKRFVR